LQIERRETANASGNVDCTALLRMGVEQIGREVCCTAGDHGIRWNRAFFCRAWAIIRAYRLGESIPDSGRMNGWR